FLGGLACKVRINSCQVSVDEGLELRLGDGPDLLGGDGPVAEQQKRWNSANVVLRRRLWILVDVELHDAQPVLVFLGDCVEDRRDHLARTAPLGPEVEQHRTIRVQYIAFECSIARMNDLIAHVLSPSVLGLWWDVPVLDLEPKPRNEVHGGRSK